MTFSKRGKAATAHDRARAEAALLADLRAGRSARWLDVRHYLRAHARHALHDYGGLLSLRCPIHPAHVLEVRIEPGGSASPACSCARPLLPHLEALRP